MKFYGAALHKEEERLKAILVMELCNENLMRYIFRHESNIPGKSSTATAARDVIGWAKESPMLWNTFTDKVSFTEISSWKIYW